MYSRVFAKNREQDQAICKRLVLKYRLNAHNARSGFSPGHAVGTRKHQPGRQPTTTHIPPPYKFFGKQQAWSENFKHWSTYFPVAILPSRTILEKDGSWPANARASRRRGSRYRRSPRSIGTPDISVRSFNVILPTLLEVAN